jgi:hypothetical protein
MASLMEMLTGGNEFDLNRKKAENPKAHENIDKLILNNELNPEIQEVIQSAIMGSIGGGGKGLKNIIDIIKSKNLKSITNLKKAKTDIVKPEEVKNFIKEMYGTEKIKPYRLKSRNAEKAKIREKKYKKEIDDAMKAFTMFAGPYIGLLANTSTKKTGLDSKIAKMLRPDPNMGTKEQHDKDMEMIIKTMSPQAQLKYLKNTGQGYPADEEMFLRAEPENTNEILLQLLGE